MIITVKDALLNEEIEYSELYESLRRIELGDWDSINSTETIYDYINESMREGIIVSHILRAIEEYDCDHWNIWLGNSCETPIPILNKEDLVNALALNENDLNIEIEVEG